MGGGSETTRDLATLLADAVTPAANLEPDPSIDIYKGVTYLMPFKEAAEKLGLKTSLVSRNTISCPGFPRNSLYFYTFSGQFDGGFNIMNVVVDKADQVVSIQLVSETPTKGLFERVDWSGPDKGWRTYNFVNYRNKAVKKLKIHHNVDLFAIGKTKSDWRYWKQYGLGPNPVPEKFNNIRIETMLMDPTAKGSTPYQPIESRPLEAVRWYLPVPLAQTILYCMEKSGGSTAAR